jgi:hypothetical protein
MRDLGIYGVGMHGVVGHCISVHIDGMHGVGVHSLGFTALRTWCWLTQHRLGRPGHAWCWRVFGSWSLHKRARRVRACIGVHSVKTLTVL